MRCSPRSTAMRAIWRNSAQADAVAAMGGLDEHVFQEQAGAAGEGAEQ